MLPAWATVLIALGGSAIGALAGITGSHFTLQAARLNIEHSEREAWRSRLVEAAQEYGEAFAAPFNRLVPIAVMDDPFHEAEPMANEFHDDIGVLRRMHIRIGLLFGPESATAHAAEHAAEALGSALNYLLEDMKRLHERCASQGELDEIRLKVAQSVNDAGQAYAGEFIPAAYEAIRPTFEQGRQ